MAERKKRINNRDSKELFVPKKFGELDVFRQRHFLQALDLVQTNLNEIRNLGYAGPEPKSFNSESSLMSEPDKTLVMFRFPLLIKGGLAGTEQGGFSVWIASLTFPDQQIEETAIITAHELLHTSLHGFHPNWDSYNGESSIDKRLNLVFGFDRKY